MCLVFGKTPLQIGYLLFGGVTRNRFVLLGLTGDRVGFGFCLNGGLQLLYSCFIGVKLLF